MFAKPIMACVYSICYVYVYFGFDMCSYISILTCVLLWNINLFDDASCTVDCNPQSDEFQYGVVIPKNKKTKKKKFWQFSPINEI